jgi:hypothetical protein
MLMLSQWTRVARDRAMCSSRSLSTRMGDDVLVLQGPGGEAITQENRIVRSGLASVGTTRLVIISVDDDLGCRGATEKQVMVEGALEAGR